MATQNQHEQLIFDSPDSVFSRRESFDTPRPVRAADPRLEVSTLYRLTARAELCGQQSLLPHLLVENPKERREREAYREMAELEARLAANIELPLSDAEQVVDFHATA